MTLIFEDKEMDYLFKVLAQRPWGEVYPLMSKITQQVQEQNHANADGVIQPTEPSPAG